MLSPMPAGYHHQRTYAVRRPWRAATSCRISDLDLWFQSKKEMGSRDQAIALAKQSNQVEL